MSQEIISALKQVILARDRQTLAIDRQTRVLYKNQQLASINIDARGQTDPSVAREEVQRSIAAAAPHIRASQRSAFDWVESLNDGAKE